MKDFSELIDQYMDQENLWRTEGPKGLENICTVARAIGYKDPSYQLQLSKKAAVGDLLLMIEDNPGLIEAMVEWLKDRNVPEWTEALRSQVADEGNDDADDEG